MIPRRLFLTGLAAAVTLRHARADTVVRLGVSSTSLAYGGLRIAEKAGLFPKNGIDLRVTVMDSGSAAMAAVLSGSLEFCSASLGEVLAARIHGQKIGVVSNIYRGLSGSLVLAKPVAERLGMAPDAPVADRLKAMGGLSIATPSATSSYTFPFRIATQAVGVQPRFVYMTQPAMVAALKTGSIQGLIAGAPFSTDAASNGSGVLWISGPRGALPADVLPTSSAAIETSEAYAAAHPDIVARLRAAHQALADLIKNDPNEAKRLLAAAYPQLSAEAVATIFPEDSPNWAQPVMTVDDIRKEIALQEKAGVLPGVSAVDPAAVLIP